VEVMASDCHSSAADGHTSAADRHPTPLDEPDSPFAGIKLVQRQKELKAAYLIRFGTSAGLMEETLRADVAICKLQKELGLKYVDCH
jgi:hypothetical protein